MRSRPQSVPLRTMSVTAEEAYARPIARLALRVLALTAVRPIEVRGAVWDEFDDLNGAGPLSRISASRMKGDLQRKADRGGDHLVLFTRQAIALLRALGHPPAAAAAIPKQPAWVPADQRECHRQSAAPRRLPRQSCLARFPSGVFDGYERMGAAQRQGS